MKKSEIEKQEAVASLLSIIKPGDTVYTILRHVSSSGMSRKISLKVCVNGEMLDITWGAAKAMGDKCSDFHGHNVITVGGCGMDMGFSTVYNLGYYLWPKGTRNGEPDSDGGYALKQRWL